MKMPAPTISIFVYNPVDCLPLPFTSYNQNTFMRFILPIILASVFVITTCSVDAQKTLAIVGSSTSACTGPTDINNCYVYRLRSYYNVTAPDDTVINKDFSVPGYNCYQGMPSSYIPPYAEAQYQPKPGYNITAAINSLPKPDVILVNYPTNQYDVLPLDSIMYCLRTIRDSANKAGIPCFVTTTQPRTSFSPANRDKLREIKDSILLEMGPFAIDFWTGLADPADNTILPAYRTTPVDDLIHLNDAGHAILAQRVEAANVFLATLPATFIQFNTVYKNNTDIITWQTAKETDVANYEIQRSADGRSFSKIATVNANNSTGNNQYQYTDDQPLKGWNYYKVLIVDRDGKKHASAVMSVMTNAGKLAIVKAFARTATQVIVELQNNEPQNAELQVLNNMGLLISKISRKIEAGSTTIYLNTPALSNGVYHIKLATAKETMVSSFIKAD